MSDLIVHEPHHVPVIDTMNRLGIAVVRVGDVITLAFKDREFMRTVGTEMINCDDTSTRIVISGLKAPSDHVATCKLIVDSLFKEKTPASHHLAPITQKPTYSKPLKPPVPPRPPKPSKEEAELPKPKKTGLTLPEVLLSVRNELTTSKGKTSIVFKEAIEPHIKKGAKIYYTRKNFYEPKDVIICKIQGVIMAACKVIKPGLRGHYLVEHKGKEVYTKQAYGKITFKKNPKEKKKND